MLKKGAFVVSKRLWGHVFPMAPDPYAYGLFFPSTPITAC